MEFADSLEQSGALVEAELQRLFKGEQLHGVPERLLAAMRHAMLGGGKRMRPFLVLQCAGLFGAGAEKAMPAAVAVELIHGYSLVHDDLPAMDNDELRRGRPTVWKAFDEWTAILAGDGLQSLAFEVIADSYGVQAVGNAGFSHVCGELTAGLAFASGVRGMVGGQALDLDADKRGEPPHPEVAHIRRLQAMKTGALIRFSCEAGAILGQAGAAERAALNDYGTQLGLAFQITDDLLDFEGDATLVGKAVSKDAAAGKATLVSQVGPQAARDELAGAVRRAKAALDRFGERAEILRQAADFVAARDR